MSSTHSQFRNSQSRGINLREDIVARRKERLTREGRSLGHRIPETRQVPLVPFGGVICEIKRRSPSKGLIDGNLDPIAQAGLYHRGGVRSVSVLTEEDYFSGSLADLMEVKQTYPELSVLRKDFLVDLEDVQLSYRAGADAVLLIASILEPETLEAMLHLARELGMAALVEVHTYGEILAIRPFAPDLVGINARNLETFQVDTLLPAVLKQGIDWPCSVVFESGIFSGFQAQWARNLGFGGILVGEAVVRNPGLAQELVQAFSPQPTGKQPDSGHFWQLLTARLFFKHHAPEDAGQGPAAYRGPLVKICGITNRSDAELALATGADILGFVFAPSPRQVGVDFLTQVADLPVLKVGVVVWDEDISITHPQVQELLEAWNRGLIDVLQLHGSESPRFCHQLPMPWYKAVRPSGEESGEQYRDYRSPRLLLDAFDPRHAGGTGKQVNPELVQEFSREGGLWLAGGLNPGNIGSLIQAYQPELVDVSSGLEEIPGKKDPAKVQEFMQEIHRVQY